MTRGALYAKHTRLAAGIAREYFLPGADMDDVHQEARVALWVATGTWDPARGPFAVYAKHAIHADLRDKVQAANRGKRRVLTDSVRDERQFELVEAPDVERMVLARERLRGALDSRDTLNAKERRRQNWRETKRRARAKAA